MPKTSSKSGTKWHHRTQMTIDLHSKYEDATPLMPNVVTVVLTIRASASILTPSLPIRLPAGSGE